MSKAGMPHPQLSTWKEHVNHQWTWPSAHGITGCEDCRVVFETPSGQDAWDAAGPAGLALWSRS